MRSVLETLAVAAMVVMPATVQAHPGKDIIGNAVNSKDYTTLVAAVKAALTGMLTYHVVAGNMDAAAIVKAIKAGNGTATLTTVKGDKLIAMMQGTNVVVKDEKGGVAAVTIDDVKQSNGVIHVIDHVLLPAKQGWPPARSWRRRVTAAANGLIIRHRVQQSLRLRGNESRAQLLGLLVEGKHLPVAGGAERVSSPLGRE